MSDYLKICSLEIKDLGMSDAEVSLLKSEIEKKQDALAKIKALDEKLVKTPDDKKLRREYRRTLNDVKDEIKSDYQRYAKDEAIGKISTLRRRAFKDRLTKKPKLLKDILLNRSSAKKDSAWGQYHVDKQEFNAYRDNYDKLDELKDPNLDIANYEDKRVKNAVGYIRTFIDQKYLESMGKRYFDDDLDHVVNTNRDLVHADMADFIADIKTHIDSDKLLEKIKRIDDNVIGFDEASEESAIGASRDKFRDTTIDKVLRDWKNATEKGSSPYLMLHKLPFKSDADFMAFTKKWAKSDPLSNYMDFTSSRYLKQNVSNKMFGGRLYTDFLPSEAFDSSFTKENAKDLYNLFNNSFEQSSEKQLRAIKWLRRWKSVTMASKAAMLPIWSFADNGSRVALEELKSNGFNFYRSYGTYFKNLLSNFAKGVKINTKGATSAIGSALKVAEKKQIGKLYEVMHSYDEYQSIKLLGDMSNQKDNVFFDTLNAFNKKFTYDPMHNIDNELRNGSWQSMIQTLKNYDPTKPIGLTDRLKNYGINDSDVKIIQDLIADGTLKDGVIEDVKNSAIRKKLRLLKYNTDLSAVPLDITPYKLMKFTNAPLREFLTFFWSYHMKASSQIFDVINQQKGVADKLGAAGLYALYSMPANLATNSLFTYLYTGENPFNAKHWESTIFGSLVGSASKPAMIMAAWLSGDNRELGMQLSNPLVSQVSNVISTAKIGATKTFSQTYESDRDNQKDIAQIIRSISNLVPFGAVGNLGYRALSRS